MILIHSFHDLFGVIVDTEQDEDKSIFIFILGAVIYDWN